MAAKVVMRLVNTRVVIESSGYLGSSFDAFRRACAGARFDPAAKVWHADAETAMRISGRLCEAGFEVIMTAEVRKLVEGEVEDAVESIEAAEKRLGLINLKLAAKGRALFHFQQLGVIWMSSRKRCVNCDDMGLGKSAQSLCALPDADRAGVLVVCPAIAKGVWKREAGIWRDDYRVTVLDGRKSFRWPELGEIVVINYDVLPAKAPAAPKDYEIALIADEAHFLKNYKTSRTKKVTDLSTEATRTIFLTGTPLPSRPEDLWCVLQVAGCAHEAFGSWKEYCRLFSGRKNPFGGMVWGKPLPEVGERLKGVLIRRMKKDVLADLPDKMHRVLEVEISAEAEAELSEEISALGPEVWAARDVSDIPFDKIAKTRALLAKSKEEAALEIIETYEEAGEPIVVFSAHRHVIDRLKGREGWGIITGDVQTKERAQIEEAFQRGELCGVAATIAAASTALTLTRASNALFVDLSYVPADNQQAEDRIYRIGTKRGVLITHLVSQHALDQHVRDLIAKKMGIIEGSVEKARGSRTVTSEEIKALLPKKIESSTDEKGKPRRAAKTEAEKRAAQILMTVAGVCDGATKRDGVGFSATHQRMGRGLALELLARGKLTDAQWRTALWFGVQYGKQVGL